MASLFIDTYFENGSPLRIEDLPDGSMRMEPLHDYERFTGNRQSTHWNFKIRVPADRIGQRLKIVMQGADNIWNGKHGPLFGTKQHNIAVSFDGKAWTTVPANPIDERGTGIAYEVELKTHCVQVARNVPYTLSDLNRRLEQIAAHPAVRIAQIGSTVEGRSLEMVEIGDPLSPRQVIFRGAAHPWESGGTWFLDGMMEYLSSDDAYAKEVLQRTCFCIMPMSNKDGVCRGMTRFNVRGMDLNRNWLRETPIDPVLMPENACLQNWVAERIREKRMPRLVVDLHNDGSGRLHHGRNEADPQGYLQRMAKLEKLMRDLTWFREGISPGGLRGSIGTGFMEIFNMDGVVYELNSEWAEGLNRPPLHTDWRQLGVSYVKVVDQYL